MRLISHVAATPKTKAAAHLDSASLTVASEREPEAIALESTKQVAGKANVKVIVVIFVRAHHRGGA